MRYSSQLSVVSAIHDSMLKELALRHHNSTLQVKVSLFLDKRNRLNALG